VKTGNHRQQEEYVIMNTVSIVSDIRMRPRTLSAMLALGHYDAVCEEVTEKLFVVKPRLFTTMGVRTFGFSCDMTTAKVIAAIRAEGCDPDGIEQLLANGAEHPDEQRKHPIVALGSPRTNGSGVIVYPCLCGRNRRRVDLHWDDDRVWRKGYRFIASPREFDA
jgi:hypothetical protein